MNMDVTSPRQISYYLLRGILGGADGGGRTHTSLRIPDFESSASANSATSAQCGKEYNPVGNEVNSSFGGVSAPALPGFPELRHLAILQFHRYPRPLPPWPLFHIIQRLLVFGRRYALGRA